MSQRTSNEDIYDRLNDLRKEIKADIQNVSDEVTTLRTAVNDNALKQAVSSTKIGLIITGITILVSGIVTILINKITNRI